MAYLHSVQLYWDWEVRLLPSNFDFVYAAAPYRTLLLSSFPADSLQSPPSCFTPLCPAQASAQINQLVAQRERLKNRELRTPLLPLPSSLHPSTQHDMNLLDKSDFTTADPHSPSPLPQLPIVHEHRGQGVRGAGARGRDISGAASPGGVQAGSLKAGGGGGGPKAQAARKAAWWQAYTDKIAKTFDLQSRTLMAFQLMTINKARSVLASEECGGGMREMLCFCGANSLLFLRWCNV